MTITVVDLGTVTGGALAAQTLSNINVPAGATIFVQCTGGNFNGNSPVPSDSVNGAYTSITSAFLAGSSVNGSCRMSYFPSSAAIVNGTLTFTPNGGSGFGSSMSAFYVTGIGGIKSSLTAANAGTGTTPTVNTNGAVAIGDFVVGGIGVAGGNGGTDTVHGFSAPFDSNSFVGGGHLISASAAVVTFAPSGVNANWGTMIAVFSPGPQGLSPPLVANDDSFPPVSVAGPQTQPARWSPVVTAIGAVAIGERTAYNAALPGVTLDEALPTNGASFALSEAADTAHFTGSVLAAGQMALAATEQPDVAFFNEKIFNAAMLFGLEPVDTASFNGNVFSNTAQLAATEARDTAAFTALAGVKAALAATEAHDAAAFAVNTLFRSAVLAAHEAADHMVFQGTVPVPGRTAVINATEAADIARFTGATGTVSGVILVATEADDTAHATVIDVSIYYGTFAVSEAPDSAVFFTSLNVHGSLAASEAPDRAVFHFGNQGAGPWFFAWADATETTFTPSLHCRWDEPIFEFEYTHEEGQSAHLQLVIKNPRVPLLGPGRKAWAWFSKMIDGVPTPRGFFRVIGVPSDMAAEKITLEFVAMPLDLIDQKRAVANTLMVRPYWDPVFTEESRRLDPDAVLEGYAASWHIDPVTHVVTVSDWIIPEDGTVAFLKTQALYTSLKTSVDQPPLKNVVVYQTVQWEQYAIGTIPMGYTRASSTLGGGIVGAWPKPGGSAGGGWIVKHSQALDLSGPVFSGSWHYEYKAPPNLGIDLETGQPIPHNFGDVMSLSSDLTTCWMGGRPMFAPGGLPRVNSFLPVPPGGSGLPSGPGITAIETGISLQTTIGDQETGQAPATSYSISYQVFFSWSVTAYLVMGYEAKRQRKEQVRFTLGCDLQPMFTDPGGIAADFAQDSELIQLNGNVGQEGPYGPYVGTWAPGASYKQNDVITTTIGGVVYGYQVVRDHVALPFFDEAATATAFRGGQWMDAGTNVYSGGRYYEVLVSGAWGVAPSPSVALALDPYFQIPIYGLSPAAHSGPQLYQLVQGFRGNWTPGMTLIAGDMVIAPDGTWYHVAIGHVTDATFNRFAPDDTGALLYDMMLNPPPIGNVGAALYYPTDRGHWSIEYGLSKSIARLKNRARNISISYDVLGDLAWTMNLRQGASFTDARLPGGAATGKITKIVIKGDGKTGASYRGTVTFKPVAGLAGPPPSAVTGLADYVVDDYAVADEFYHDGATNTAAAPADAVQYSVPDPKTYDDGLTFPLSKNSAVISEVLAVYENPTQALAGDLITNISSPVTFAERAAAEVQAYQSQIAATQTWYVLTLKPVQNGPFAAEWDLDTTPLQLPNQFAVSE